MLETIVTHPATAFGKRRIWALIEEMKAEQARFEQDFTIENIIGDK